MYHKLSVQDFISSESGVDALQNASEIILDDEKIANHERTTNEIKECCKDIKVLGRKELRLLLSWWKHMKDAVSKENENADSKSEEIEETETPMTQEEEEDLEDAKIQEEINKIKEDELRDLKRKKKKASKERQKLNEKLNLKMVLKGDEGPVLEGDDMFTLKEIKTIDHLKSVSDQTPDILAESEDDEEESTIPKRVKYDKETGHLDSSGLYYKDESSDPDDSDSEASDSDKSGLGLSDTEEERKKTKISKKRKPVVDSENNPLITDLDNRDKKSKRTHKAQLWFEKDIFKNLENEKDEDYELDKMVEVLEKKGGSVISSESKKKDSRKEKRKDLEDEDSDYDVEEMMSPAKKVKKVGGKDGFEVVAKEAKKMKKRKLTEEDLALGSLMMTSKKSRRDLIDGAWNRYMFNDDNLPDWFREDEEKHMKKETPVPKELAEEYKKRVEDLNVRPIKKVLEAKARKKKRAIRKLEKAKKKAEAIMDNVDISDREKAQQVNA